MARAWAALLGVCALRVSDALHVSACANDDRRDREAKDDRHDHEDVQDLELEQQEWGSEDEHPGGAGGQLGVVREAGAGTTQHQASLWTKEPNSPFRQVTLLLLGVKSRHVAMLEEGYRSFFQEVVYMQWISDEEMDTATDEVKRHQTVLLHQEGQVVGGKGAAQDASGEDAELEHEGITLNDDAQEWPDGALSLESKVAEKPRDKPYEDKPYDNTPWRWSLDAVAGPIRRHGRIFFGCRAKLKQMYVSLCLPQVLNYTRDKHVNSRGIFVALPDFWFDPMEIYGGRGSVGLNLNEVWQLDGQGLRGPNLEKLGNRCWRNYKEMASDGTHYWANRNQDADWNASTHAYKKRNYGRRKPKPHTESCMGWVDAYYLPRNTWATLQAMLPSFERVVAEVALPTVLNYITRIERYPLRLDDRCWGGCCFMATSDTAKLTEYVCGRRMNFTDKKFVKAWTDMIFNATASIYPHQQAKFMLKSRYSSNNVEVLVHRPKDAPVNLARGG